MTTMAQSLQQLQTAIAAIGTAVDNDAAQDQLVIAAIQTLIARIEASDGAKDFTNEVAALAAAASTLATSNASIQVELDKVVP